MSKFFLTLVFTLATVLSAHANNCLINVNVGGGIYPETAEASVQAKMEKALAKKGYVASTSADAEYTLRVNYGHAMTETDCYVYAAMVQIMNSGKQVVAESTAETSFLRELLAKRSIAKAMTLKSFKKVMKTLPTCVE